MDATAARSKGPVVIGNIEDDCRAPGGKLVVIFLRLAGWGVFDRGKNRKKAIGRPCDMNTQKASTPDGTTSAPLERLSRSTLAMPLLIFVAASILAGLVLSDNLKNEAALRRGVKTEYSLRMESTREHVEEFFVGVRSDLLYISLDAGVQALSKDSRKHIQSLFDHQWKRGRLSEIYVVERDFDGKSRPFLTFEYGSEKRTVEELHSLEREREEYETQRNQIRRFVADPGLRALISPEIKLCLEESSAGNSRGIVYSVPVPPEGELTAIAAAMIPSTRIEQELEHGGYTSTALLVGEQGNIFTGLGMPENIPQWFQARFNETGIAGFFKDLPESFQVESWMVLWTPVQIPSAQQWWLVFLYDMSAVSGKQGLAAVAGPFGLPIGIFTLGIVLSFLTRVAFLRTEDQLRLHRERKRMEKEREQLLHDTGERVKELRCMYGTAESIRIRDTLEQVFGDVVALIPPGWQYPEITRARLRFGGREYFSEPFEETEWKQSADIVIDGERRGTVEVFYLEDRPELDEGPFLKEERNLLDNITHLLGEAGEKEHRSNEKGRIEEQYHQARKLESIGRLAGGVSHDLNNLLSPIIGYGEMLLNDLDPGDARREFVDQILRAGLRARDLVRQLLAFSRKQTLEYKPVDMNKAVTGFEKLLRRTIREDIEIEIIPSPDIGTVMADINQIEQVILNLVVNASDAMPEGGCLTIETASANLDEDYAAKHQGVRPGAYVMLAVSDTGCGMDDETREHAFEPFFSTKGEQGTGLGLATVYGIVKQHGGNIWVYSELDKGTTFKIYLPVSEEARVEEKTCDKIATDLKGSETILLVEDDEQVRDLARAILRRQGYTVLVAENGLKALTVLASHDDPVQLLLTDVVMPEMNGKELFIKAAEKYPGLKVLYMSGYTANVIAHRGALEEGIAFIQKPFTVQALTAKVREVLEQD